MNSLTHMLNPIWTQVTFLDTCYYSRVFKNSLESDLMEHSKLVPLLQGQKNIYAAIKTQRLAIKGDGKGKVFNLE